MPPPSWKSIDFSHAVPCYERQQSKHDVCKCLSELKMAYMFFFHFGLLAGWWMLTTFHLCVVSLFTIHNILYVHTAWDRQTESAIEFAAAFVLLSELWGTWRHGGNKRLLTSHPCRKGHTDAFNTGNNAAWNRPVWPPSSQMGKIIIAWFA